MNKILIVKTSWYEDHISKMFGISKEILGKEFICLDTVAPGALELSALASHKISTSDDKYKAIIFLGIVIRGETSHYDYVCNESARALMQLSIEGLSIGYGILTCENKEQAIARANPKGLNKGKAATLACLRMIELKKEID